MNDTDQKPGERALRVHYIKPDPDQAGQRLDNFLRTRYKSVPKSKIYNIIRKGELRVNGRRVKAEYRLQREDEIRVPPLRQRTLTDANTPTLELAKKRLPLEDVLLYEDDSVLVVNKPIGLAVHGGSQVPWGLIEALRLIRTDLKFVELGHRLDRETSGALVLAKKRSILKLVHQAFSEQSVEKIYWALLAHRVGKKQVTVDLPLEKNIYQGGERMVRVSRDGKPAATHLKVLEKFDNATETEIKLDSGRTHQIRVHTQYLGHPVIGDQKYGDTELNGVYKTTFGLDRMCLHAQSIDFEIEGKTISVKAPLDDRLLRLREKLAAKNTII